MQKKKKKKLEKSVNTHKRFKMSFGRGSPILEFGHSKNQKQNNSNPDEKACYNPIPGSVMFAKVSFLICCAVLAAKAPNTLHNQACLVGQKMFVHT